MKFIYSAAALLSLTVAAPALAQAMPAGAYVKAAGASDLFERQSAELVMKSTQNPKIKSFAAMMIHDHGESTAMVKAAAMRSGLHPKPPMLMPKQSHMLAELRRKHGADRDMTYVTQQKAAHDEAQVLQEGYASNGTAPALRMTAGKIVPVVKHHIEMLGQM
jgi:putative membrane protein